MIVYELAQPSEWVPYLASVLAPLVPIWILGRAAAERPACPGKQALYWAWTELILPYILGMRVPHDTLFIIAESDWCFSPEHETVLNQYIDDLRDRKIWCPPAPQRAPASNQPQGQSGASSSETAPQGSAAKLPPWKRPRNPTTEELRKTSPSGDNQPPRRWQWWYPERRRRRVRPGGRSGRSRTLNDIVFFCNTASYHGVGELIWLSYDGYGKNRPGTPGNGSTAIAITKSGAELLQPLLSLSAQPGHIDQQLREILFTKTYDHFEGARMLRESASYAWNGFGGYHSHISGCDRRAGFRVCSWTPPIQPYTRVISERPARDCRNERWVVACSPSGSAQDNKICAVDMTEPDEPCGSWVTYCEPEYWGDLHPDPELLAAAVLQETAKMRPASASTAAHSPEAFGLGVCFVSLG